MPDETQELIYAVLRMVPQLRTMARYSVRNEADDLVQDVVTAAIDQIRRGTFRFESSVSTWVVGIYRIQLLAHRRMQRGLAVFVACDGAAQGSDAIVQLMDPETCYNRRLHIERAIQQLSIFQRHVVLRKEQGHSAEFIANEASVSPDFVDRQFKLAREVLRKLLK